MGARFFSPDYGSFIQEDFLRDALGDLDLATDPLTSTRYGLAGGNPTNFVEVDGHAPVAVGVKQSVLLNNMFRAWNSFMDACRPASGDPDGARCSRAMWNQQMAYSRFNASFASGFSWIRVLKDVSGVTDFLNCVHGSVGGCLWTAATVVPVGRIARGVSKLARGAAELARVRRELRAGTSVWDLSNYDRGLAIETKLGFNVGARNFPVVDRWVRSTGTATSIKSLKLTAKTYKSTDGIFNKLRRDINALAAFNGRRWGGFRIRGEDIRTRRLLVALPPVRPSPDQLLGMARAWRYAR